MCYAKWTFFLRSHWSKVKGLYIVTRYLPFTIFVTVLWSLGIAAVIFSACTSHSAVKICFCSDTLFWAAKRYQQYQIRQSTALICYSSHSCMDHPNSRDQMLSRVVDGDLSTKNVKQVKNAVSPCADCSMQLVIESATTPVRSQLPTDPDDYIITVPGITPKIRIEGLFIAADVQDKRYIQMAALEAGKLIGEE
ncbi:hypothetical protein BDR07DRAFT_1376882 [Suillus spraguei]|nr:hypothetical protein BDR07DRAFT_1376882 [Suillus spraguei]